MRCGFAAQAVDFPDYKKIHERAEEGEEHHRDADGVLVKAFGGGVNARRGRESAETEGYAYAADRDDRGAGALQDGEDNSGPT